MKFIQILCILLAVIYCNSESSDELVSVSVIFRHGDRTIVEPYPNDPYKNLSYWPEGFGQLTNKGKMQQYVLGQWFGRRYESFLQHANLLEDVYIYSTDKERTLMSAESTLAGLFPPTGNKIWNPNLKWQPLPIHTVPMAMDNVLAMKKVCPRYETLYRQLKRSPLFLKIQRDNQDLYSFLTPNVGYDVKELLDIQNIYNTLFIENKKNYTLPNWAKLVFPSTLKPIAGFSFATPTFTTALARLKVGPFMNRIATQFENSATSTKFLIHSAHDTTIAHILSSLEVFEYHCPPYSATIMFELRKLKGQHFVNILYKNGSIPHKMVLKRCKFNCPLDKFLDIIQPIRMTVDEWEYECKESIQAAAVVSVFESKEFVIGLILCMLIVSGLVAFVIYVQWNKRRKNQYGELPGDDGQHLIPFA